MKTKIYFDNCAIGNLYINRNRINLTKLIKEFDIYLSAINMAELLSYKNIPKRNELLRFFYTLNSNDYFPLDFPTQFLKETYIAIKENRGSNLNILEFGKRLLYILKHPDEITEDDIKVCENYTKSIKNQFELRIKNAKKNIDLQMHDYNQDPILYLKSALKNEDLMNLLFDRTMKLLEISDYNINDGAFFIPNYEPWLFYFGFDILAFYMIVFKPKSIPHQLDIMQVVYLSAADYFITDDRDLFDLLNIFVKSDIMINVKKVYKLNEFLDQYNLNNN